MCDLPFDVIECTSELYQVRVGGRRRAKEDVPQHLWIGRSASRYRLQHRGRLGVGTQAEAGQQALQRRGTQRLGGAITGSPGPVQPTATLGRLRCPDHNG